jgi:hypothetical protein
MYEYECDFSQQPSTLDKVIYRSLTVVSIICYAAICVGIGGCAQPDPSGNPVKGHPVNINNNAVDVSDEVSPPKFSLGDVVAVPGSIKVGIVVAYTRNLRVDLPDGTNRAVWTYTVMFQNSTIYYTEEKLELVEPFDWNQPARGGIVD